MENICKNCKFWNESKQYSLEFMNILGKCERAKPFWEATEWNDDCERVLKEENKNDLAFTQDGSDYISDLLTKENFACNQFETKIK